jgi:hypothetical protein
MAKVYWLDGPAVFRFVGGVWECSFTSGGKEVIIHATPQNVVGSVKNLEVERDRYLREQPGEVVCILDGARLARGESI